MKLTEILPEIEKGRRFRRKGWDSKKSAPWYNIKEAQNYSTSMYMSDLITDDWELEPEIVEFKRGMIVRHKGSGNSYVVESSLGEGAIAVKVVVLNNPDEWEVVE